MPSSPLRALLFVLCCGLPSAACAQQQEQPPPQDAAPRPRIGDKLVGTRWQAETLRGEPVADPSRATIDFLPGDHVRGQVACNRYVAPFASRADRVTIGPVRVSRLRCDDGAALQARMVDVLQRAGEAVLTEEPPVLELVEPRNPPSRFVPRESGP